jgi:CRISPR-associated endoribonuclease Cas6
MPYAIDFPIGETEQAPPPRLYRALYANLLTWFDVADAELAHALHERPVRKPFTISALNRDRDGQWRWRVTLLEDDLFDPLWTGVQAVGVISLHGHTWPIHWRDARFVHCSYKAMLTDVYPTVDIKLNFLSPTMLQKETPGFSLPDPLEVFQRWLDYWNDFGPAKYSIGLELLEVVRTCVAISAHRIHAKKYDLDGIQIRGFVGRVTYKILNARELNQAQVWQLNTLADYAEFCGTGYKTSHGMGQTRRLRPRR